MADDILSRDANRVTVLGGVTDDAAQDIKQLKIDPATGRLLVSIQSSAGTPVYGETPSGTINGSNVTFTLAHTPSPATSLAIYLGGVRLTLTTDYSLATATITFVSAPGTGDAQSDAALTLRVDYTY